MEIRNKRIVKKGNEYKYFRIVSNFLITPRYSTEGIEEKGTLEKIFKRGMKFVMIGVVSISSGILSSFMSLPKQEYDPNYPVPYIPEVSYFPITISLTVIIIGLIINMIFKTKRKKGG